MQLSFSRPRGNVSVLAFVDDAEVEDNNQDNAARLILSALRDLFALVSRI